MRETPSAFTRRTSIAYAPPDAVRVVARPLTPDEPCPALHRYPGPCGLADWFAGALRSLAPGDLVWMSARAWTEDSLGALIFGTLAVREPLRFQVGLARPGIYVGAARPLAPEDDLVWLPPAGRSRAAVIDELCAYLEELDAMRASGARGPGVPWLAVPEAERRCRLVEAGVAPVWTGAYTGVADAAKIPA